MTRALVIAALLAACGSKGSKPVAGKDAGAVAAVKDAGAATPDARPAPPDQPTYQGDPYTDAAVPAGTLRVTLTRGATKTPAAGVTIYLVALDLAGAATIETFTTDAAGAFDAPMRRVDGTVAYHVLGELDGDRLESGPVNMDARQGMRVDLAARAAGDPGPPLPGFQELERLIPEGEAWVTVTGATDATDLTLVEVTTSRSITATEVAQGQTGPGARFTGLTLGSIYVVQLRHRTGLHVSRPLLAIAGAGAGRVLMAMVSPMVRCQADLRRHRDGLSGWTRCDLWQAGGIPRELATPLVLPLPEGATSIDLHDPGRAMVDGGVARWNGIVPPGMTGVDVEYKLPVIGGRVDVAMVSPMPMAQVGFMIEAGISIEVSGVVGAEYRAPDFSEGDGRHYVWKDYTTKDHRLAFTITGITPATPCELLGVARWTADGNPAPAPEVIAEASDGTEVRLSSLRGQPVVLNLFASWTPPSAQEVPSLIALSRVIEPLGAKLVVVASDQRWDDVKKLIDPTSGMTVWLDRPNGGEYVLGDGALSFGTKALPETYLIDAAGLVRYWVVNARDWTTPDALACIQSLKTPWTGATGTAPPPHVKDTPILGGTIRLGNVTIPRGGVLFISARNQSNGPPLAAIRVDGPVFPQSFAMTQMDMLSADLPLQGEVEVIARVDGDGDITTTQRGDVFGIARVPAGSTNVQIAIDQVAP